MRVPLSAWRVLRATRHVGQRLGVWKWPRAAKERRSSSENVNGPPQSRQVRMASVGDIVESVQAARRGVALACFAQQPLSRVALPGARQIRPSRWANANVGVAILAHQLPAPAEDPQGQGPCA